MLGRCCEVTGVYTFKGLAEKAFGHNASIAIQCVVLSYTTGTCVAFVIFAGDFTKGTLPPPLSVCPVLTVSL